MTELHWCRVCTTWVTIVITVVYMHFYIGPSSASAQSPVDPWAVPQFVVRNASAPLIIGDPAGTLHVFYVDGWYDQQSGPEGQAIMHMQYANGTWSDPSDVLVSPTQTTLTLDGIEIDEKGNLHLLWNDTETLYHSIARTKDASKPQEWHTTSVISGQLPIADIDQDETGTLHVIARPDPFTASYLKSTDGGVTWSDPVRIITIDDTDSFAIGGVHLAVADPQTIHATWFLAAKEVDWNFWSVWYTRSLDGGQGWDESREMASPLFGASDIAVDAKHGVHLVYGRNIGYADGRWHQWSEDGGTTWSAREPLFPGFDYASGDTGGFDFATDSAGRLHLVNSIGASSGEATAYHMEWQGDSWSQPELVLGHHAHFPRIAIVLGNNLDFVAMAGNEYELWFRNRRVDAPALAPRTTQATISEPALSPQDATTESSVNTELTNAEVTARSTVSALPPSSTSQRPTAVNGFQYSVLIGIIPALLLVIAVIVFRQVTRSTKRN